MSMAHVHAPTPSIISKLTVRARIRHGLLPSNLSVSFDARSQATSTKTTTPKRILGNLLSSTHRRIQNQTGGPAPAHEIAHRLAIILRETHAAHHRHRADHELERQSLLSSPVNKMITVCHDLCEVCHAPILDTIHTRIDESAEQCLSMLILELNTSSLDYRTQAAQYLTILMLSHPIIHEYLLSQGIHVAAEMALHGAKNQVGACDEGSQDMPNLLSLYELSTALGVNPVRWSVNEVFRRKPSLNVDVWREYMENDLGLCHKDGLTGRCARTRLCATLEYTVKRYGHEDINSVASLVHSQLHPRIVQNAWNCSYDNDNIRLLRALYTAGHPRTSNRTAEHRIAQWQCAWLPMIQWLSSQPTFPAIKSLHFWVEGIASDISQMPPLALPSEMLNELFLLLRALTDAKGHVVRGKPGVLLQIVENALAGSVIVEICSQREDLALARFDKFRLIRAGPEPQARFESFSALPACKILDVLEGTQVYGDLRTILSDHSVEDDTSTIVEKWDEDTVVEC